MKYLLLIGILFIENCVSMPAHFHETVIYEGLFYEEAKLFKTEVRNMFKYSAEIAKEVTTFEEFENNLKEYHIRRSNELEQSDSMFFHSNGNFVAASLYGIYCRIVANKTIDKVLSEIGLSETQEQLLNKTRSDVINPILCKCKIKKIQDIAGIYSTIGVQLFLNKFRIQVPNDNLRFEIERKIFEKEAEGLTRSYHSSKNIEERELYGLREPEYYLRKMYKTLYPGQEVPDELFYPKPTKGCVIM